MDKKKLNDKLRYPAQPESRSKMYRGITLTLMFFVALAFLPEEAYSQCDVQGDIPFTVSNNAITSCFFCSGPWARTTKVVKLQGGQQNCQFYAAKENMFSPYGDWTCIVTGVLSNGKCNTPDYIATRDACLRKGSPLPKFFIDVNDRGFLEINSNLLRFCGLLSVPAFLGDNPGHSNSRRDTDVFRFTGTAGDEVRLTLEPDPNAGYMDGEASFGLQGESIDETTEGLLPLELNATLPADAVYSISVEEPRNGGGPSYRGDYSLTVESRQGVDSIEPTENVEK